MYQMQICISMEISTNNIVIDSGVGNILLTSLTKINTAPTGIVFNGNSPSYYSGEKKKIIKFK